MECALKTALFYSTVSLSLPFYSSEKKSPCHSVNDRHLVWHTRIILDNKYLTIHSCYFCKKERKKCKKSQELFENHGNENIYFSWFLVLVGACNAFEDETDKLSMTTKTTWVWQLQRGYLRDGSRQEFLETRQFKTETKSWNSRQDNFKTAILLSRQFKTFK